MAKQTEPQKRTAVWNPPRLVNLSVHTVESGTRSTDNIWEGGTTGGAPQCTRRYRVPTSSEVVNPHFLSPALCVP